MKIQAGKRYVRRDGKITGPMEELHDRFYDPNTDLEYDEDGQVELRNPFSPQDQDPWDLKSEYTPDDKRKL